MRKKYELTDRGKIIIVVVIALIMILLALTIFNVGAWSDPVPPNDGQAHSDLPEADPPEDESSGISDEPLPDSSGLNPDDPDENGDIEQGSADQSGGHENEDPIFGPLSINLAEGTMSFLFSPSLQEVLDPETALVLSEFLTSPLNTNDAHILVEMPLLPEDDVSVIISAVSDAFAQHGVTQSGLAYITHPTTDTDATSYVIALSFIIDASWK